MADVADVRLEAEEDEEGHYQQPVRKLSDVEKNRLIDYLADYPALWKAGNFTREERSKASEELCLKFSLTEENLRRVIHSLRSSLIRELKRAKEREDYESTWKFFKRMAFMKDDVMRSLTQESSKEWSDEEVNILIDHYQSNPVLWDHRSKEYRDRDLRKLALDKLKEMLQCKSEEEIKMKWHLLKTIYQREEKRQEGSKTSGKGTSEVYKTKWKFFEVMAFIKQCKDVDESQNTMSIVDDTSSERGVSYICPPAGRKRKVKGNELEEMKVEMYKSCMDILKPCSIPENIEPTLNEDQTFGKTVADTLARFTDRQKAVAKKRISDVLFETEMGFEFNNMYAGPSTSGFQYPSASFSEHFQY